MLLNVTDFNVKINSVESVLTSSGGLELGFSFSDPPPFQG